MGTIEKIKKKVQELQAEYYAREEASRMILRMSSPLYVCKTRFSTDVSGMRRRKESLFPKER